MAPSSNSMWAEPLHFLVTLSRAILTSTTVPLSEKKSKRSLSPHSVLRLVARIVLALASLSLSALSLCLRSRTSAGVLSLSLLYPPGGLLCLLRPPPLR